MRVKLLLDTGKLAGGLAPRCQKRLGLMPPLMRPALRWWVGSDRGKIAADGRSAFAFSAMKPATQRFFRKDAQSARTAIRRPIVARSNSREARARDHRRDQRIRCSATYLKRLVQVMVAGGSLRSQVHDRYSQLPAYAGR